MEWSTKKENQIHARKNNKNRNRDNSGNTGFNCPLSKQVKKYTKDNIFIMEFGSISEAERNVGLSCSIISKACKGIRKHAGGYIWKYS